MHFTDASAAFGATLLLYLRHSIPPRNTCLRSLITMAQQNEWDSPELSQLVAFDGRRRSTLPKLNLHTMNLATNVASISQPQTGMCSTSTSQCDSATQSSSYCCSTRTTAVPSTFVGDSSMTDAYDSPMMGLSSGMKTQTTTPESYVSTSRDTDFSMASELTTTTRRTWHHTDDDYFKAYMADVFPSQATLVGFKRPNNSVEIDTNREEFSKKRCSR